MSVSGFSGESWHPAKRHNKIMTAPSLIILLFRRMSGVERTHCEVIDQKVIGGFQHIDHYGCHIPGVHHIVVRFGGIGVVEKTGLIGSRVTALYLTLLIDDILLMSFSVSAHHHLRCSTTHNLS